VFSEEEAKCFPPNRPEDHQIVLMDGVPSERNCKTYKLTTKELDVLDKHLKEQTIQKFIAPSSLPLSSPIFFVPKKTGDL
jgi:hypothetical protein